MKKAVFLDRDGVINANVFNVQTGAWESPHEVDDFHMFPWAIECLSRLQDHGFQLFLVSNQPSYAKGKTSLENIEAIHQEMHAILNKNRIYFTEYFYCYHHPDGIVPGYSIGCDCRKPGTFFLNEAQKKYKLDMKSSWMIGDRDSDIICGQKAGCKTIFVQDDKTNAGRSTPDFKVNDLREAIGIISAHI